MDKNQDKSKAEAKSTYIVESPVTHDRAYDIGDEIELTEAEAKPLLGHNAIAHRHQASNEALEAPKLRQKEADERENAAARVEYEKAKSESADADAELKAALAKSEAAKRKSEAANTRLSKIKAGPRDGPHTWEQDADRLGGDQLSPVGDVGDEAPATAPEHGSKMTPSTPTAEATKHRK